MDFNNTRRKLAIASWSAPREGNIYGKLTLDATEALAYIEWLRAKTGDDRDGAVEFTMSGNMQLMNSNSVTLAAELRGWSPPIFIPDTALGRAERARSLSRWATDAAGNRKTVGDGRPVERVLLVGLHDHILFTPDAAVAEFAQEARRSGWRPVARIALPGGGAVEVLVRG